MIELIILVTVAVIQLLQMLAIKLLANDVRRLEEIVYQKDNEMIGNDAYREAINDKQRSER